LLNQRVVGFREKLNSKISIYQVMLFIEPYIKLKEKKVSRTTVGTFKVQRYWITY